VTTIKVRKCKCGRDAEWYPMLRFRINRYVISNCWSPSGRGRFCLKCCREEGRKRAADKSSGPLRPGAISGGCGPEKGIIGDEPSGKDRTV
jgi:hypothetical protein